MALKPEDLPQDEVALPTDYLAGAACPLRIYAACFAVPSSFGEGFLLWRDNFLRRSFHDETRKKARCVFRGLGSDVWCNTNRRRYAHCGRIPFARLVYRLGSGLHPVFNGGRHPHQKNSFQPPEDLNPAGHGRGIRFHFIGLENSQRVRFFQPPHRDRAGGHPLWSVLGVIVLLFQAALLAHGGFSTLGANTFSMGVAGPLVSWGVYKLCQKCRINRLAGIFLAASLGDLFTYCITSIQLALDHPSEVGGVLASAVEFLGVFAVTQVPLAIVEGLLTVVVMMGLEAYAKPELQEIGYLKEAAV